MEAARNYNAWLFSRCEPYLGRRVLDVGAGIGTFVELAAPGREVVAAEPDPAFWPLLAWRFGARPNVEIVRGTADDVRGAFESILCLNVLEHIADDRGALARFHELLVPGGRLLVLTPAHPALYGANDRAVAHERRYRKSELRGRLEAAEFEVETLRLVNPVGALGWFFAIRLGRSEQVPEAPLRAYDKLVPLLRLFDRIEWPLGLSVWAVARRTMTGGG
jgi:SAM-dependent methyltransferase